LAVVCGSSQSLTRMVGQLLPHFKIMMHRSESTHVTTVLRICLPTLAGMCPYVLTCASSRNEDHTTFQIMFPCAIFPPCVSLLCILMRHRPCHGSHHFWIPRHTAPAFSPATASPQEVHVRYLCIMHRSCFRFIKRTSYKSNHLSIPLHKHVRKHIHCRSIKARTIQLACYAHKITGPA
jgi:hypothetical protein